MSGPFDGALFSFGASRTASATAERGQPSLAPLSSTNAPGDVELPENLPPSLTHVIASGASTAPTVLGATLTCTRCRRRFNSFFTDPSLPRGQTSLRPSSSVNASLPLDGRVGELKEDGLCASERLVVAAHSVPQSAQQLAQLPVSEVIELHRRRREKVLQQMDVSRAEAALSHEASKTATTPPDVPDHTQPDGHHHRHHHHHALASSVQTAAGAYHPLQPSLFAPQWPSETETDTSPTDVATAAPTAEAVVAHLHPTPADKTLLANLPGVFGCGFASLRSPALRESYQRRLWSPWLASTAKMAATDAHAHDAAREEEGEGGGGGSEETASDVALVRTLYEPTWRAQEWQALARVVTDTTSTQNASLARSTPQRSASWTAPADDVDALRWFPIPRAADAVTVQAMDFPEAHESNGPQQPQSPSHMSVLNEQGDAADTRALLPEDPPISFGSAVPPRAQRSSPPPPPHSPRQSRAPQGSGPASMEALHRRLWRRIAAESGARMATDLSTEDADAASGPSLLLLPPLCATCWSGHGLARARAAAGSAYTEAIDFGSAIDKDEAAPQRDHHRNDEKGVTNARTSHVATAAPAAPLWRDAVATLLASPTSHSPSMAPWTVARPAPPARDSPATARVQELNEALTALHEQHTQLAQEAASLTARLAQLDAVERDTLLPTWQAMVNATNIAQVRGFTEDGVDEARGRLQQSQRMAHSECFVRRLSLLRAAFPIDVTGAFGCIAGLRLGTVSPYSATTNTTSPASDGTSSSTGPRTRSLGSYTAAKRFLLPDADADPSVLASSAHTDELREVLTFESRQVMLAQASLSGVHHGTGASDSVVSALETNTACGYLLQLLDTLATINKVSFSRAVLHPRGDASVIDLVKPLPAATTTTTTTTTAAAGAGGALSSATAASTSSSAGGWFSWGRSDPLPPTPPSTATRPMPRTDAKVTREVERTLDFSLKTALIGWKSFGAACVAVLGCVKELCERLADALRAWRRQQLTCPMPQSPASPKTPHTPKTHHGTETIDDNARVSGFHSARATLGFPHVGRADTPPLAEEGRQRVAVGTPPSAPRDTEETLRVESTEPTRPAGSPLLLAHAQVSVTLDPPFAMGADGTIHGFSVQHGSVSEALWSLAMKKMLANVLWCVQATVELKRLHAE